MAYDWSKLDERIGVEGSESGGVDTVNESWIRFLCEAVEFDCPLCYDKEVAQAHGYDDVVAPPVFATIASVDPYWKPGDKTFGPQFIAPSLSAGEVMAACKVPVKGGFVTDITLIAGEPLYPGDRVYKVGTLTKVFRHLRVRLIHDGVEQEKRNG